ncbi:MAG: hypothetical protein ACP5RS_07290, partial [Thermoplasmata archaeon]
MKKIAFLISDKNIYSAGIKPFVDIGHGLYKLGINPYFYALGIDNGTLDGLNSNYPYLNIINANNINEIAKSIKTNKIELIISDDFLPRLKYLYKIKKDTGIKTASYIQLFYGLNSISKNNKKQWKYWIASFVPWKYLSYEY